MSRQLRTALEERLKRVSREEGIDLQRLRRQVAFDRFPARLFRGLNTIRGSNTNWVLKRGYAMELRFQTVRVAPAGPGGVLLKQLQDAGAVDVGEFFSFRIGEAMMVKR